MRVLPRRRLRPRTAVVALLTLGFAALVVLPEALSASGLTATHRQPTVPTGLDARRAVVLRPNRVDLVVHPVRHQGGEPVARPQAEVEIPRREP